MRGAAAGAAAAGAAAGTPFWQEYIVLQGFIRYSCILGGVFGSRASNWHHRDMQIHKCSLSTINVMEFEWFCSVRMRVCAIFVFGTVC